MSNNFYVQSGWPAFNSNGDSQSARSEFSQIESAFNKMPTITANGSKIVRVNAGATGMEAVTLDSALAPIVTAATPVTPTDTYELPIVLNASGVMSKLTWAQLKTSLAALTTTWGISTTGNAATATTAAACTGNSATATLATNATNVTGSGTISATTTGGAALVPTNATNATNATNITGSGTISATTTGGAALVPTNATNATNATNLLNTAPLKLPSITVTMATGALTFSAASRYLDFAKALLTDGTNDTLLAAPANLVLPSGGTLGTPTTTAARIVVIEMNVVGVAELAVVNIAGGNDLSETGVISTTAISATSTANNVFYSTTARTGVAYRVVGIVDSVNTAGAWADPTLVRGAGGNEVVNLTRKLVQSVTFATGAFATGTTVIPLDDTIPQSTEGDQYLSLTITPTNPLSTLEIEVILQYASTAATNILMTFALFKDAGLDALTANASYNGYTAGWDGTATIVHKILAGSTVAQTFKVRAGPHTTSTFNLNGRSGARTYGGVSNSRITIKEYLP